MFKTLSKKQKLFWLTAATASLIGSSAMAQSLPNANIQLIRKPTDSVNEVTLRLATKAHIDGCVISEGIDYEAKITQYAMDIKAYGYTVRPPMQGETCYSGTPAIYSDITLNKNELVKQEVKKILFHDTGVLDIYNLTIDGTEISLKAQSQPIQYKQAEWELGGRDPLSNHFLEKDAVILFIKDYPHVNINDEIIAFADKNGMTPANFLKTEPQLDSQRRRTEFPVRDSKGLYTKLLKEKGSAAKVGEISILNDRNGPYRAKPEVSVFDLYVKKP